MASSKREYELAIKIIGKVDKSLGHAVGLTKSQIRSMVDNFNQVDDALWGGLKTAAKWGLGIATAVGAAGSVAAKQAFNVGEEFEKAMSHWSATADATLGEYNVARDAAMEWGRKTTKTATDAANALEFMALAGWDVNRSVSSLPGVLRLAEAGNLELAEASDLVVNAMSATSTEAKDLDRFLNVAARANNKSNQTAGELLVAWEKSGAMLHNLNVSIEESATAFGMLANRGMKAEVAGTSLNRILVNMTTGRGIAGKAMAELGISAFDDEGKFIGLKNALEKLNEATKDMTEEDKNRVLSAIAGQRQIAGLNNLMASLNNTLEDGTTEWDKLYDEVTHADGALERMAAIKMDNLAGDLKILESALQDAGIRAYDGFAQPMRDATQLATQAVYRFSENVSDKVGEWYPTIKRGFKEAAEGVLDFAAPLMSLGNWCMQHGEATAAIISGIVGAITTHHMVRVTKDAAVFLTKLLPMLNPVSLALLAIGGAITAITVKTKLAEKALARKGLKEAFGDITLSAKEMNQVARAMIGERNVEKMESTLKALGESAEYASKAKGFAEDMRKLQWKVQMGYELTSDDAEMLKASIDQNIQNAIEAVQHSHYTANVAVDYLFGEGSSTGEGILTGLNSMYTQLSGQVEALGKQLGDEYSKALADGMIDLPEMETIAELSQKLARITQQVSDAQFDARREMLIGQANMDQLDSESVKGVWDELDKLYQSRTEASNTAAEQLVAALKLERDSAPISSERAQEINDQIDAVIARANEQATQNALSNLMDRVDLLRGNVFANEADTAESRLPGLIDEALRKMASGTSGITAFDASDFYSTLTQGMSGKSVQAITDMVQELDDQVTKLEEVKRKAIETGQEVPQAVSDGLQSAYLLQAISGDTDAIFKLIAEEIDGNPAYETAMATMQENGAELPQTLAQSLEENASKVEPAADKLYTETERILREKFSKPIDVPTYVHNRLVQRINGATGESASPQAEGGIYGSRIFAEVAEAGYPEAIIPIKNTPRAEALYETTGEMLRATGANTGRYESLKAGSGSSGMTYAPTFQFTVNGNADEGTIRRAVSMSYNEFKAMYSQMVRDERRLAY